MADTNTYEIMTAFLDLVEEPESRRANLANYALRWMNYGYQKVCDDYIKPSIWEQITPDSAKKIQLSSLGNAFKEVRKVARYKDGSPDAGYGVSEGYPFQIVDGSDLIVPNADISAGMWLWYYYHPPVLTMAANEDDADPNTIPSLILPDVRRVDLHFLVAAKYGARRSKFATKAPYWEQQFIAAFEDMKPPTDSVKSNFRNKFPAQPF